MRVKKGCRVGEEQQGQGQGQGKVNEGRGGVVEKERKKIDRPPTQQRAALGEQFVGVALVMELQVSLSEVQT